MGAPVDLKRLRTFVAVAEHGGVSSAAARLRVTQPALSRQLRELQGELGVRLLEPVGRRLLLTGEGEEFLPHCRRLLGHADAVAAIAEGLLGQAPPAPGGEAWRLVAVDVDGADLAAGERVCRLHFSRPVSEAGGVRAELVRAAREGRARTSWLRPSVKEA